MNVSEQRKVADLIMAKLVAIDPEVILAGGAPRDWFFGNEATDFDFYVHAPAFRTSWEFKKQLEAIGLEIDKSLPPPEDYENNPDLFMVYNISGFGVPVQVMVMKERVGQQTIDKFGLSLSKIYYKDGVTISSWEFKTGSRQKVMWKCGQIFGNHEKYIEKIKGKFPDFEYFDSMEEMVKNLL